MTIISTTDLARAKKILFITHLAIGDFTYLHNFFAAFAQQNPHIQLDLWIDELRRSSDPKKWPQLKKYSLYDWANACPFFSRVYQETYSPELLEQSIQQASAEDYPLIISLATLRPWTYASLARRIGPSSRIIGIRNKPRWYAPWQKTGYAKLDAAFAPFNKPAGAYHITEVYADWFRQLSNLELSAVQRMPEITVPAVWQDFARDQINTWCATSTAATAAATAERKIVFINSFAKTKKRCWPLASVAELVRALGRRPGWSGTCFIINTVPSELEATRKILDQSQLENTHLFSATENFFQLPAILASCDLIISVETAVMHLANAVHVPLIALMRQKNPEWVPIDAANSTVITTLRRGQWIDAITVEQVIKALP